MQIPPKDSNSAYKFHVYDYFHSSSLREQTTPNFLKQTKVTQGRLDPYTSSQATGIDLGLLTRGSFPMAVFSPDLEGF